MAISFDGGNDKESGTAGAETLSGLGGNDDIKGLGGNDTIIGGTGHDSLDGGVGNDKLKGDAGKDKLLGGVGNDLIEGGVDDDVLDGGNGNDTLNGGAGKDAMSGGEGNDTFIVDNKGDKVTDVTTGTKGGIDLVSSSISYVLGAEIENLTLTGDDDLTGTGNDGKNVITGNNGSNVLNGGKGNDTINGNEGDDTIDGGAGVDQLAGGDGSDVYMVGNNEDRIVETAVDGDDDEIQSSAPDYELGANIERLTLLPKGEDGIGNELANTLDGNALDNELNGDAGDDTINGNDGNDILDGGEGNDEINGGDGYDVAVYLGSEDDYKWFSDEEGWIVEDITGAEGEDGVDEGTDTLTGIEVLSFSGSDEEVVIDDTVPEPPVELELPVLQVNATELMVDESGKTARITVTLSEASDEIVTVQYAAIAETATAGSDYKILGTGTLKLMPGKTSQTITTTIINDTLDETDETFSVQLTNPQNATLDTNASTVVTIIDNDEPALEPESITVQVTPTKLTSFEGEVANITVTLSAPSTQTVTVDYTTKDVTAKTVNGDYIATTGSLTFAPNETSHTIVLETLDDTAVEQNESFRVQLSNPVNATLKATAASALITIVDDSPQCVGTEADDHLTCSDENNDIDALSGNDVVNGMGGNDTLIGNTGNDTLAGGDGNDQLLGGEGDDVLQDSNGNDNMSGGLGDDRFVIDGKGTGQVLIEDTGGIDTLDAAGAEEGVTIQLTPGEISSVGGQQITLSEGGTISDPLDMYFLEDLTGSFSDDVETVQELVPNVVTAIHDFQPDSLFGLGSFMDKPIEPFGQNYDDYGYYGDYQSDYVYANNLNLTTDQAAFSSALNALVLGSGNDWPESQLEALMQVALHSNEIGFRSGAVKTVVLMTDADYHVAGDGAEAGITTANNGDGVLDGSPAGTGEDYPTVPMVAEALQAAGILPIFAVTSDAKSYYVDLVSELGFGSVVDLTSDSSNLVAVITAGINNLTVATVENAIGSAFNDTIIGDANANILTGGAGVDQLTGGAGGDTFVFRLGDSAVGADERDIIKDFSVSTANEVIDLSTLSTAGLSFIGTAEFDADGQVRYVQDVAANMTLVQINLADVVDVAEMEIQLTGKLTLTANDFILA